jgi:hypothetical protein
MGVGWVWGKSNLRHPCKWMCLIDNGALEVQQMFCYYFIIRYTLNAPANAATELPRVNRDLCNRYVQRMLLKARIGVFKVIRVDTRSSEHVRGEFDGSRTTRVPSAKVTFACVKHQDIASHR